jgi:hypothetical protein
MCTIAVHVRGSDMMRSARKAGGGVFAEEGDLFRDITLWQTWGMMQNIFAGRATPMPRKHVTANEVQSSIN